MIELIGALAFLVILIVLVIVVGKRKKAESSEEAGSEGVGREGGEGEQEGAGDVSARIGNEGGARRRRGARDRVRDRSAEMGGNEEEEEGEGDEEGAVAREEIEQLHAEGKIGVKKMQKMLAKEEKKRMREAMEKEREERLQKEEEEYLERKAREKEEEEREAEEEQKRIEEKKKAEEDEYNKWKDMFDVEEEGTEELSAEEEANMLNRFCEHIRMQKIVVLEDLAKEFKLRTPAAIDRVKQLEEMGRITGVFDDRGKFIYITDDEMKAVAKFIQRRGRLSIADLVDESNKLIDLEEKE
mmetsp:Transcript_30052/g.77529  ORF Transcript_30052/g.77529 Transcript_30052/m.77529 type:complete len:299 (-) Transcript_30052:118-1014(-)